MKTFFKTIKILFRKKIKNNKVIYINGRFLTQKITGVQRYATEVTKQLDNITLDKECIILAPENGIIQNIELKNIEIKKIGCFKGYLWEQISLPLYIFFHNRKAKLINMCNLAPILYPGYTVIHDIAFKTHSEHLDWKFVLAYKIITRLNIKRYKHIFTVSEFSKKEIIDNYKIKEDKITVTYSSAEHIRNIKPDDNIIDKLKLRNKEFCFSLGSKSLHKNHKYILECAKQNPDMIFVISGNNHEKVFKGQDADNNIDNLIFTGYVTDEELVSLYKECKMFIFPSLYEGFGVPPLEAIEMGCKNIILSDIEVLREIYGNVATYVDTTSNYKLKQNNKICSDKEFEVIKNKYSWNRITNCIIKTIESKN